MLALTGCAQTADVQRLQDENSNLRGMVASDHQQIADLQEQIARLNDRIVEMQHADDSGAGGQPSALNARVAKLESQLASLRSGANAASGAAGGATVPAAPGGAAAPGTPAATPPGAPPPDTTAPSANAAPAAGGAAGATPPSPAATNNDSDDNDNSEEQTASVAAPPAVSPPPAASAPVATAAPSWRSLLNQEGIAAQSSRDSAARLYRAGLNDLNRAAYASAVAKFQVLQRKYPKSALSEPAEFFSAIALYQLGKYDQSILQFNDVVIRFPRGRFASPSLLNEAQAFMKINDRIDARLTLQKLLNDHPGSPEAPAASVMLNSLASN